MSVKDGNENDPAEAGAHCAEDCIIGLEECAECGACSHCSDGAQINESDLPSHWQRFIEKSRKSPSDS